MTRDFYSSLFWLLIGAGVCYGGYDLELGTLHDPGSGFLFFWLGIIMMALSVIILIPGAGKKGSLPLLKGMFSGVDWPKILYVLLALSLYGYAFNALGFILATILLLLFLFKAIEPQRWWIAVFGSVASSLAAYVVFQVWLGCQLPSGLLGIG
jgi:putative tricarboxylic transport membrane protein